MYLPLIMTPDTGTKPDHLWEQALLDLVIKHPDQKRKLIQRNPVLMELAQVRVDDMIERAYFAHINPDGVAANYLACQAGFPLPAYYRCWQMPTVNSIESLAGGYPSAQAAFEGLLASPGHRAHVLGELAFYAVQTELGVGYAFGESAHFKHYWCILIAESEMRSGE